MLPAPARLSHGGFGFQLRHLRLHRLGAARRGGGAREAEPHLASVRGGRGSVVRDAGHRPPPTPNLGRAARGTQVLYSSVVAD